MKILEGTIAVLLGMLSLGVVLDSFPTAPRLVKIAPYWSPMDYIFQYVGSGIFAVIAVMFFAAGVYLLITKD
jgi:hypothetical protein